MFRSLYTKSPSPILRHFCDLRTHLRFLTSTPLTRSFSSTISAVKEQLKNTSFTVSYLINSCGLSPQAAISASKKVQFLTPERPDSVLTLLNKHGFTNSQMAKIVKNDPRILLYDSEKIILPKFKFFSSIGITGPTLAQFISSNPPLLSTSLRNRIIPGYEFLMNALLFDDDMVIKAMSNQSRILRQDVEKISAPNLLFLRQIGTPQSLIQQILMHHPSVLCHKADKFHDKIKELIDMGFCPTGLKFIYALQAILLNESNWQRKIEVYGRCGWSKDEILKAFKKDPRCMHFSEKKVIDTVHFLVNVMDLKPSAVAANPYLLSYSLKKRTIPRGLVFKTLMLKGVLEKKINFHSVLLLTDKCFLKMYIDKHLEDIPYLLDVFDGRKCPEELGFQYEQ